MNFLKVIFFVAFINPVYASNYLRTTYDKKILGDEALRDSINKCDSNNDFEGYFKYAKLLLKSDNSHCRADGYFCVAKYYLKMDNLEKAYYFITKAIPLYTTVDNRKYLFLSYHMLGIIVYWNEDFIKAKEYYLDAEHYLDISDSENRIIIYYALASVEVVTSNFQEADNYFQKIKRLNESLPNNLENKLIFFNNVGNMFEEMGNYNTAITYYNSALAIFTNPSINYSLYARLLDNKGYCLLRTKREGAIILLNNSLKIRIRISTKIDQAYSLQHLIEYYFIHKKFDVAKKLLSQALNICESEHLYLLEMSILKNAITFNYHSGSYIKMYFAINSKNDLKRSLLRKSISRIELENKQSADEAATSKLRVFA